MSIESRESTENNASINESSITTTDVIESPSFVTTSTEPSISSTVLNNTLESTSTDIEASSTTRTSTLSETIMTQNVDRDNNINLNDMVVNNTLDNVDNDMNLYVSHQTEQGVDGNDVVVIDILDSDDNVTNSSPSNQVEQTFNGENGSNNLYDLVSIQDSDSNENVVDTIDDEYNGRDEVLVNELFARSVEEANNKKTGLSKSQIESLDSVILIDADELDDKTGNFCAICIESYDQNTPITYMKKCNHSFHTSCIKKAFEYKKTCPICRQKYIT